MPRIRSKQIYADALPVNNYDVVNKEYLDMVLSGATSGSTLTIQDEGLFVSSGVTTLNFIGDTVRAMPGIGRVDVYIPAPNYVSHFNTNDGTTDARISDNITTTLRYIATPTSEGNPYSIGNWTSGNTYSTIRNSVGTLIFSTLEDFSLYNSATTINVQLLSATQTEIVSHSMVIAESGSTNSNGITITITDWQPDSNRFKAKLQVSILLSGILPQGGRFSVVITHDNGGDGIYTFNLLDIFRDSESLTANLDTSVVTLAEGNSVVTKYISGVQYYTLNTQWFVSVNNINNLNSRTYPTTQQLNIDENNLFISSSINVHGLGGSYEMFTSGWTSMHDNTGANYTKNNWTTNQINQSNWNHSTGSINSNNVIGRVYDWSQVDSATSINYNFLIDTYQNISGRNSELFMGENTVGYPRLKSDYVTPWDSNESLLLNDGLQVISDRLTYPQFNFELYNPDMSNQPNYSGVTGNRTYCRKFETNGNFVSNGVITFGDHNIHNITESDLTNGYVTFRLSKDSGLTWYTLNSPYIGGVLVDGSGCRVNSMEYGLGVGIINSSALAFTMGSGAFTKSLLLEIIFTYNARNKYIGQVDFTEGNWI